MTKTKVRSIVNDAWWQLEAMCNKWFASDLLRQAISEATEGERAHRRVCDGYTGRYRASVETAARYMVIHWVFLAQPHHRITWLEAAQTRRDAVLSAGVASKLRAARVSLTPLKQAAALDYVDDLMADPRSRL